MARLGLDRSVEINALPFRMKVRAHPVVGEARDDNNERSLRFDAITKKNSMLIIDGRPRWETRYLRNLFQRDERWQVSLTVAGPGACLIASMLSIVVYALVIYAVDLHFYLHPGPPAGLLAAPPRAPNAGNARQQ